MLTLASRVRARPNLLVTEIEGEVVMMDVEGGQYYNLDRIGSSIWKGMADPIEIADLCRDLEREYDAPPGTIERDVLAFLSAMAVKKLILVEP